MVIVGHFVFKSLLVEQINNLNVKRESLDQGISIQSPISFGGKVMKASRVK